MKRSEMLNKLQDFYAIRHIMVEIGHITPDQFMAEVLNYVEHLGMIPPKAEVDLILAEGTGRVSVGGKDMGLTEMRVTTKINDNQWERENETK